VLISLPAIGALTFFFQLVSIHIPVAGDQEWSGYDVLAKSRDVDRKLDSFRDIGKSDTASGPWAGTDRAVGAEQALAQRGDRANAVLDAHARLSSGRDRAGFPGRSAGDPIEL
jgi:hypothetical protein